MTLDSRLPEGDLADKWDNHKFDISESESLLIGTNFAIVTDIETGPNGNLFVVSFHPEITGEHRLHERFLGRVRASAA